MFSTGAFGFLLDYMLWWFVLLSVLVHTWCFFRFFPWRRRRTLGLFLGNALVFVSLLGVVAMAGESYFRFVAVQTDAFGMSMPALRWFRLHTSLNSLGCRDEEWPIEKPPGVRRIAFVGDSFTFGWGLERTEDRFTDLIEMGLQRDRPGAVEILNVARPGWGTGDQLDPIRDITTRYGADEVVLCYVPNDIEELLPTTAEFDPTEPPQPVYFNPRSSALLEFLHYHICVPRMATVRGYLDWLAAGFADEEIWRRHQQQLGAIVRYCRDHDVKLRAVLLPFIRFGGETYEPERVHDSLRQFLEGNGVEVVDLLSALDGFDRADLTVNRYDAHPNERAHQLFADAIRSAFYGSSSAAPTTPSSVGRSAD